MCRLTFAGGVKPFALARKQNACRFSTRAYGKLAIED